MRVLADEYVMTLDSESELQAVAENISAAVARA